MGTDHNIFISTNPELFSLFRKYYCNGIKCSTHKLIFAQNRLICFLSVKHFPCFIANLLKLFVLDVFQRTLKTLLKITDLKDGPSQWLSNNPYTPGVCWSTAELNGAALSLFTQDTAKNEDRSF
jgi:hypothetical protein